MGNWRLTLSGVGDHGANRSTSHGETVTDRSDARVDEICQRFVQELKEAGGTVNEATLHHWPGTSSEVVDNLLTGKRLGSF